MWPFFGVALRLLGMLGRFIFVIFVAKKLSLSDTGSFGLLIATASYIVFFVGLDFYYYSNREIMLNNINQVNVIFSQMLVYLPGYVASIIISYCYLEGAIGVNFALISLLLIFEHIATEISRLLVCLRLPVLTSVCNFIRIGGWCWVIILLFSIGNINLDLSTITTYWAIANSIVVGYFFIFLVKSYKISAIKFVGWEWIKYGLKTSLFVLVGTLSIRAVYVVDRYFIENYFEKSDLGVYTFYSALCASIIGLVEASIFSFKLPILFSAIKSGDKINALSVINALTKQTIVAVFLIVSAMILFIYPLLDWINKNEYKNSIEIYYVLLFGAAFFVFSHIPGYMLYSMGKDRYIVFSAVISIVTFLGLIYPAAVSYGVLGVALSQLFAVMLLFGSRVLWAIKSYKDAYV